MNEKQRRLLTLRIHKNALLGEYFAIKEKIQEVGKEIANIAFHMTVEETQEVDKFYRENIVEREE